MQISELEEGGYIIPKIWARDGERVAKEEIKARTTLGLPLGNWPKYLKGFQKVLKGEGNGRIFNRRH